jgi:hypothetical protein
MGVRELWATMRSRSSRLEVLATVGLLVAAVVGFGAPTALDVDSPRSAAIAYLSAAARSDAKGMLASADVRTDPSTKVDSALLDEAALSAALPTMFGRPTDVQVAALSTADPISVTASYRSGDATRQLRLTLDKVYSPLRIHPVWKVRVVPTVLVVQVPAAAGDLTVDGRRVAGSAGKPVTVAIFPGLHVLSTSGGPLLVGQGSPFDGTSADSSPTQVGLKLTAAGQIAAAKAVKSAFESCPTAGGSGPGCPSELLGSGSQSLLTLIGDPNDGAAVKPDLTGNVNVVGHFQMIETIVRSRTDAVHRPISGGYRIKLTPAGDAFTPGQITLDNSIPSAARPAGATDQAILDVVRTGLVACAQAALATPPDCPQTVYADTSNVQWTLQGDPMAGASVAFDPDADLFKVVGRITLGYSYDSSLLGIGLHTDSSAIFPYTAELLWAAEKPLLVTIGSAG